MGPLARLSIAIRRFRCIVVFVVTSLVVLVFMTNIPVTSAFFVTYRPLKPASAHYIRTGL